VVAFCKTLSEQSPLLLVVEDAHWADSGTLTMLRHLARRTRHLRVLLLVTYREVELDEALPLNDVLLDLNRERLAVRLKLKRLNREETRDMLAALFAEEITEEFLNGIYDETEGNPFFIEEVCKALIDSGELYFEDGQWNRPSMEELEIPQNVRVAIQSRVRKLPDTVNDVLRLAAILGREFDFDTLVEASDQDEEGLIDALELAERAQIIQVLSEEHGIKFIFSHALIPATLRDSISSLRRRRLHQRAAQAIEIVRPDDYEALVHHYTAGGLRKQAIEFTILAAQRAIELYSFEAARQHLIMGIELIEAADESLIRLTMFELLADVHFQLGEHTQAIPIYEEALEHCDNTAETDKWIAVQLHRKIVYTATDITWFADYQQFETTVHTSKQAGLQLTEVEPPHIETVRLLTALSHNAWFKNDPPAWDESEQYARNAVEIAQQLNELVELSAALGALSNVHGGRDQYRKVLDVSLQRLELSREPNFADRHERTNILNNVGSAYIRVGEYEKAIPYLLEAESISNHIQAVGEQVTALKNQAFCNYRLDRWDEVLEIQQKWKSLEHRFSNFYERIGPICFQIALNASVYAMRGMTNQANSLRNESLAIMNKVDGPPNVWDRDNHY
jgi:tetratricopeptide (TPR) repeat protein